jgi:hypothetical protein
MSDLNSKLVEKFVNYLGKDDVKRKIQMNLIDPLLNHVMSRVFPYLILTLVMFVLLLFSVLIILGILVFQIRKPGETFLSAVK